MRKTIFFIFGILFTVALLYWIDGYYVLIPEKRGNFLGYIQNDASQKFRQAKTNIEDLPDLLMAISKGQGSVQEVLIIEIQKALEVYYLSFNKYPERVEQIIKLDTLPKDMRLEYKRQEDGYILRLINKEGKVLKEIVITDEDR
ncbi:MAG: hypothetical protein AAB525_00920 [Patescibacteria group bacterium]